jgi:hypothetical protein
MDPTATFRVRRVLVGVLVGLVLLSAGFYGWVQYRRSQYEHQKDAVLSRYHDAYAFCLTQGRRPVTCAASTVPACTRDVFWTVGMPFDLDSTGPDADERCRAVATG